MGLWARGLGCLDHGLGVEEPNQLSDRDRGEAAMVVAAAKKVLESTAKTWEKRPVCAVRQREIFVKSKERL